jgi:hypothetical protein
MTSAASLLVASPVLTRPTNSLANLVMLPTQGMNGREAINLGMASSCKPNCTKLHCVRAAHLGVRPL